MNTPVKEKLLELLDYLNHGLVERDSTLKAALLTMLAGENLLLVGPPGTAKSLIARKVAECLAHDGDAEHAGGYFEYLLTKFSTPEEIFGPLSISELKADRFKRNTAGYLPSVRMAFLDEIFKASSSILNALLTILNERLYHNGAEAQKVPLQALIAASNELPTGQEELDALYDRFLVRSFVDYVSEDNLPRLLDKPGTAPTITALSSEDIGAIRQAAEAITLPANIVSAIQKIWSGHKQMFKDDRRENLSDRRLRKVVGLLCISAATNGRKEIDLSDLLLLKDCLWNHPDNAIKVRDLVMNALRAFSHPLQLSDSVRLAARETTAQKKETAASKPIAKIGAVVKGYKGSGTKLDPILIETVQDLAGLERPEVGQKGYYFRQTADIDCRDLTTWLNIAFQGQYDGGGYSIDSSSAKWLLQSVLEKSQLSNLHLNGLGLAANIKGSKIFACSSVLRLLGSATDCTVSNCTSGATLMQNTTNCVISQCESDSSLIMGNATSSTISYCRSGGPLISKESPNDFSRDKYGGVAAACTIKDCQVQVDGEWCLSGSVSVGGIATEMQNNSVVERCFVAGKISVDRHGTQDKRLEFSGIASVFNGGAIRQCAIGAFDFKSLDSYHWATAQMRGRIAGEFVLGDFYSGINLKFSDRSVKGMENNIALDCHEGESNPNGQDGKSISASLFNQHYLEHTLDWDFKTVWHWNDALKQPELRAVGVNAAHQQPHSTEHQVDMGDLLQQQLKANLWL